jgi:predicted regulator of Ras-like GTPase activity (Roadblock/LC7/MglB family)
MFGAFSKLFKKSEPAPAPAGFSGPQSTARFAPPPPRAMSKDETGVRTAVPRPTATALSGADSLTLPYSAIIKLIPQELWGKLAPAGVAGYNYTISRKSVLEQLPHGAVKVSFGELRRGAPSGVFIATPAEDNRLVDLPLSEILDQLHPDSFARRPDQARVDVSPEVPDLFGAKGERLAPLRVMEKKEINTSSIARQNAPSPAISRPQPLVAPVPGSVPTNVTPFSPPPIAPATPAFQSAPPIRMPSLPPSGSGSGNPTRPAAPISFPLPKAPTAPTSSAGRALPRPVPSAKLSTAAPAMVDSGAFLIGLDAIAENWPDGVRGELAQLKMPDAKVALPSVEICEGLKRGRIQYPWRTLRSWIQPTPVYASPSPHDEVVLELPLRTLTPLFLDYIRANPVNRQSADAENITEFFRKAEQASGTSPDLLQPLFEVPPHVTPVAPVASRPLAPPTTTPAPPKPRSASVVPFPSPPAAPVAHTAPAVTPVPTVSSQSTEAVVENGFLCLPFPLIATGWPEPVLRDIAQFGLAGARVEIPLASVEGGLKSGRLEFAWRELCAWLNPQSKPAQVSINGELRVPLPLGLIAPIFMKSRTGRQRKKTSVSDKIPDLFSAAGTPLPQPPAAEEPTTPARVERAPAPVAAAPTPAPIAAPKKVPANLSELFGEPDKKTWTPNEIVQRTTTLPHVAGAMIALQDGLLVASNMPPDLKTETIAAFVPQIFGRLNQYSKELQMGVTTAVSFTVDAGTVQVFNAGIIYFVAFGKDSTLLPLAELRLIAGELSRHTK